MNNPFSLTQMKLILLLPLLLIGCTSPVKGPVNPPVVGLPPASQYPIVPRSAPASNADELVLSKETLVAQKVTVPNGGVTIRKVITTTPASATVDVRTESYEIVRTAPTNQSPDFSPKEIGLTLTKEQAQGVVQAQVVEIVKLNKTSTSEGSTVNGNLRTETVEIVK